MRALSAGGYAAEENYMKMTVKMILLATIITLCGVFTACDMYGNNDGGEPAVAVHIHKWGAWAATEIAGTEERVCGLDHEHVEHRLTGTSRFTFELISGAAAYRVIQGAAVIGTVRIPAYYRPSAELEYQPVIQIAREAFRDCTNLTGIIIPDIIPSIGREAFRNCANLTSVSIPGNVDIGEGAFRGCTDIASIKIGHGGAVSGFNTVFYDLPKLTAITVDTANTVYS